MCMCVPQAAGDVTYSIVRPTAFFKSLAGQVELVKTGKPYVMFGDGTLAACKPISERDLASFIADCVQQEDKVRQYSVTACCTHHTVQAGDKMHGLCMPGGPQSACSVLS